MAALDWQSYPTLSGEIPQPTPEIIEGLTLFTPVRRIPGVHPVVDEWVEHGVGHGEPVEAEVDVLDVGLAADLDVVVGVDEVHVVGQPAHREDDHHHDEHLHHLRINMG